MSYKTKAAALVAFMLAIGVAVTPQNASAESCKDNPPPQQLAQTRPIPLGISGGNIHSLLRRRDNHKVKGCFSGTLGSLVQDSNDTQYILSNNHVIAQQNHAHRGQRIIQPGLVDVDCLPAPSDTVARFSRAIRIKFGRGGTNTVDAAIAEVVPGAVSPEILFIGEIAGSPATPVVGQAVEKMGRTSCLTSGVIAALDVNIKVNYSDRRKPKLAKFVNQILVTGDIGSAIFGAAGDSGSLIVTDTGCPQAVALLFAGTANGLIIANPIDKVLSKLNVSMVGTCSAGAAAPADAAAGNLDMSAAVVESARSVRDRNEDALMSIAGALGTGIGSSDQAGQPAIKVYVDKLTPEAQAAAPKTVEGVPVDLVESGEFVAL